jgi:hypothetical protein
MTEKGGRGEMKGKVIQIELTLEQKEQLKKATDKEVSAIEVRLETLEDRLTPGTFYN